MDHKITLADPIDFVIWRHASSRTAEIVDIQAGSARRVGIGRELVQRVLNDLPKNISVLYAITRFSNTIAQEFYDALGFRVIGRLHKFYVDGGGPKDYEHALMYGLDL